MTIAGNDDHHKQTTVKLQRPTTLASNNDSHQQLAPQRTEGLQALEVLGERHFPGRAGPFLAIGGPQIADLHPERPPLAHRGIRGSRGCCEGVHQVMLGRVALRRALGERLPEGGEVPSAEEAAVLRGECCSLSVR